MNDKKVGHVPKHEKTKNANLKMASTTRDRTAGRKEEFTTWRIPGMRDIMKEVEDNIGRKTIYGRQEMKPPMACTRRKSGSDVE